MEDFEDVYADYVNAVTYVRMNDENVEHYCDNLLRHETDTRAMLQNVAGGLGVHIRALFEQVMRYVKQLKQKRDCLYGDTSETKKVLDSIHELRYEFNNAYIAGSVKHEDNLWLSTNALSLRHVINNYHSIIAKEARLRQRLAREIAHGPVLAAAMGRHARLGRESPLAAVDDVVFDRIQQAIANSWMSPPR